VEPYGIRRSTILVWPIFAASAIALCCVWFLTEEYAALAPRDKREIMSKPLPSDAAALRASARTSREQPLALLLGSFSRALLRDFQTEAIILLLFVIILLLFILTLLSFAITLLLSALRFS